MNTNWTGELSFDAGHILNVVDVAMSEKEEAQFDSLRDQPITGTIRRVEKDPTLRAFESIAIGLENPAGKASKWNHG